MAVQATGFAGGYALPIMEIIFGLPVRTLRRLFINYLGHSGTYGSGRSSYLNLRWQLGESVIHRVRKCNCFVGLNIVIARISIIPYPAIFTPISVGDL